MILFHSPSFLKSCTMGPKNQHEAFGKVLFSLRRLLKMRDFLWIWQSLVTQDTFGQHNWGKKNFFFWPRHSMYLSYTIKLSKNGKIIRCEKFLFYFDILTLSLSSKFIWKSSLQRLQFCWVWKRNIFQEWSMSIVGKNYTQYIIPHHYSSGRNQY